MPPKVCGDLFYDNDAFANHLRSQHSLPENKIFTELSLRRIGENFQSRFWCGFCERVLPLKERGSKAWDERYNHIDDHFKSRSINDWLDVEIKKRKGILKKEMEMDRRDFTDKEGGWQDSMESEGGALRRSTEADVLVLAVPKGKNNGDNCLDCEHEFCTTCDRRKHESEAEENIDYSLRSHTKNASSSQA
ncbi:hypothetical protein SLS58_000521 [Diplodia intermedia]|uniref:C2H2-type domain-containing protein n=1 Tax=Diplodia intermedia TaxID=856260 RepID=A0ABR3U3S0_9PEZI